MENYFLIATISSILFYAVYYFFLQKEAFHQLNRFYLIGALMLSLIIPFVRFTIQEGGIAETGQALALPAPITKFIYAIQLPEITVTTQANSKWSASSVFLSIYLAGVAIFALLFMVKLIKIGSLIIHSSKKRKDKFVYIKYDENIAPFSFFNFIFINADVYNDEEQTQILLHEQIHVLQRHSIDLIVCELVSIILWFNPIMLLYKRSLQVTHEYLADHRVLQYGFEKGAYLNLLLRQLTLQNEWMIGHHFNYLLTKNRFKMLKKNHYSKWALAKFTLALPFIALLLMLNCKNKIEPFLPEETSQVSEIKETEDVRVAEIFQESEKQNEDEDNTPPERFVEVMPEPVGGFESMYEFLRETLKYPAEAKEKGISGQVFLEFVVEKDGSISNVKVLVGVDSLLDAEALRAVKLMPKWKPGTQNGKPVRCFYQIPVRFAIN